MWIISASDWLFKKNSITMHGNMNLNFEIFFSWWRNMLVKCRTGTTPLLPFPKFLSDCIFYYFPIRHYSIHANVPYMITLSEYVKFCTKQGQKRCRHACNTWHSCYVSNRVYEFALHFCYIRGTTEHITAA